MPTITRAIIESYLNCRYKGHLRLGGERGTPSEYGAMLAAAQQALRAEVLLRFADRFGAANVGQGTMVNRAILKQGMPMLVDAGLEDDGLSLRFDGLKRMDGRSLLGEHHYLPIVHPDGGKLTELPSRPKV